MNYLPISIIIPTMNRPKSLKRTLLSIISFQYLPNEIIIIDQSSDEKIRFTNKSIITNLQSSCNLIYIYQNIPSSTKARNIGIEKSSNDIIVFSDDDVDVYCNTLKSIYNDFQDESVALIAGVNKNYSDSNNFLGYLSFQKSFFKRKKGHVTKAMYSRYPLQIFHGKIETEWAAGFYFAVRKTLCQKWNVYFDEALIGYAYAEDMDFTYLYYKNAKNESLKCLIDSSVIVNHLVSQEYRLKNRSTIIKQIINRRYLSYKHFDSFLCRCACIWSDFMLFCFYILNGKKIQAFAIIHAQKLCLKYRKQLITGDNLYELYNL